MFTRLSRLSVSLVLLLVLGSCGEGPVGPEGPAGPMGPGGERGAQGPPGLSGHQVLTQQFSLPNNSSFATYEVSCPEGKVPLGGGHSLSPMHIQVSNIKIGGTHPISRGWSLIVQHQPNFQGAVQFTLTVYAICATTGS